MSSAEDPLAKVLWIGGGSAGGKSTMAARLAADHGLTVYRTDEELSAQVQRRLSSSEAPLLHRFLAMDMDERWVNRSPREMLETFHWFRGEGFDLLIDDVRSRAADGLLVVEGFHLLPGLLAPVLHDRRRAVWLLPTPEFREQVVRRRVAAGPHFVDRTSDPGRALANLSERDRLFTEQVRAEVRALGLMPMDIDGSRSIDDVAADLARHFGLA
ncbi:MAG: hypothetical protein OES24_09980 [Acidimicrobiia bacterium]|nr:hypothetical protein [Acidimicrobiia bacterium]